MKHLRLCIAVIVIVGGMATFTSTAHAAGKAPRGNPLTYLGDDDHWSNLSCGTSGPEDFLVAPAGNAGWLVGDPDRMYVLTSITGEFTVTYPDTTQDTYSFTQQFGQRTGRSDRITCTGDFGHEHDGVVEEGVMTFVLARIW